MSEMVKIGALWSGKDKDGNSYLSGKMDSARLLVFKNNRKQNEKSPDWIVYVTRDEKRDDNGSVDGPPDHEDVPF